MRFGRRRLLRSLRGFFRWKALVLEVQILSAVCAGALEAAPFDLIVCGNGGEEVYSERFREWGERLRAVLVERLGHPEGQVALLTETGKGAYGVSSAEEVRRQMERLAKRAGPKDDVFVYLIGHGSYRRQAAKLNLPGPDLSAETLDGWLDGVSAKQVVVINAASASAGFINALSGQGRVVCTSTQSVEEQNATWFMAFFVQALEDGSADVNRDERISVLEACRQASVLTQAWYEAEGYVATEHALLDDNGDGLGMRLTELDTAAADGALAARCFLRDFQAPPGAPDELVQAYQTALEEVQALVSKKTEMDSAAYYRELEARLLRAARLNRQMRALR